MKWVTMTDRTESTADGLWMVSRWDDNRWCALIAGANQYMEVKNFNTIAEAKNFVEDTILEGFNRLVKENEKLENAIADHMKSAGVFRRSYTGYSTKERDLKLWKHLPQHRIPQNVKDMHTKYNIK